MTDLSTIESKIDTMSEKVTTVLAHQDDHIRRTKELECSVFGNGKPGLLNDVAKLRMIAGVIIFFCVLAMPGIGGIVWYGFTSYMEEIIDSAKVMQATP